MSKAVFLKNPSTVYDIHFSQIGGSQVRLVFDAVTGIPSDDILLSGLQLINEHNSFVQTRREDYKYIYRRYEDNPFIVELCNDGIAYVAPKPATAPEQDEPVLTEEELAEQERQNKIQNLDSQISSLKSQLSSSDYKVIKSYEYSLANEEIEYDMAALHEERQVTRTQINALEDELRALYGIAEENGISPETENNGVETFVENGR